MRKVPPILKPIALLTLSILIATTSGILNNASYRQVKATTPTTESTSVQRNDSSETSDSMINESSTVEEAPVTQESNDNNGAATDTEEQPVENLTPTTEESQTTPSSTEEAQTTPTQQQPANEIADSETGDSQ
ncbi:hypothetical protein P7H46_02795 [Enterococcus pseudoavium]|uniref:Uncharacterized protein n=1 Tax=Enterococcus pseudoavium TaxID=44007 RepID=A0ABU3FGB7_9ENTE|nr:hypothetical protein [Enterococcus pseudoavium]MDT2755285.1 hypothetical protein [Enterococcus pseudoavium]MDT2769765.1 hypothetical protein [Enterococcus pseudoavium]